MNAPYFEVGNRIMTLRKELGYSRERLAELADISVQFLADIEKGRKNMTITTLKKLCSALRVTTDYIISGTGSLNNETETELLEICKTLSHEQQKNAVRLLRVFTDAIDAADNNK